jgi:hypothetical protein
MKTRRTDWNWTQTIGKAALLGAAWLGTTGCTYLSEDGAVVELSEETLALDLPDHCEATRTPTGYTITCDEAVSGEVVLAASEFAANEAVEVLAPITPEVDYCDDPLYETTEWVSISGPHITMYALAGTPAALGGQLLVDRHEAAYGAVRLALEIDSEPLLDLIVSPSRSAARYHGLDYGLAIPGLDRIEAVYDGSAEAFLRVQPGYLLTSSLLGYVVPAEHYALPLLAVGLADHLDQSGRDLHLDYAYAVVSGVDGAMTLGELGEADVWGENPAVGGSLVAFLAERHGMPEVIALIQATAVTWQDDGYFHADAGFIDSEASLEALLAVEVPVATGESWEELRAAWQLEVLERLSAPLPEVSVEDRAAIVNLVLVADLAQNVNDVDAYRAVMDGFYCDDFDDAARFETASQMTQAFDDVETQVLAVYPAPTLNYRSARVLATREQGVDGISTTFYDVEKFPTGWRIIATAEW